MYTICSLVKNSVNLVKLCDLKVVINTATLYPRLTISNRAEALTKTQTSRLGSTAGYLVRSTIESAVSRRHVFCHSVSY